MDNTFPIKAIWENEIKVFAVLQNLEQSFPIYSTLSLYFLFLTFLFLPSSLSILTLSSFRFIRLFFIFLSVSHTTHFVYFYLFFFPVFLCFLLIYSPLFSTCISLSLNFVHFLTSSFSNSFFFDLSTSVSVIFLSWMSERNLFTPYRTCNLNSAYTFMPHTKLGTFIRLPWEHYIWIEERVRKNLALAKNKSTS